MKNNFTKLSSFFLLAITMMVSSVTWAASTDCSFAQGETIYFRIDNNVNWTDAGAYPAAVFYYSSNSAKDTKTNGTNWDNMSGSCNIGSNNYTKMTSLGNRMYSVTIPRNDIGYIRIVRVSGGDANWTWNNQKKMSVDDAKTNNCIYCNAWDNSGTWEKYSTGRTNTCGEPLEGDYWVVSDNNNWVKYQSTYKMHSAGTKVALKLVNIKSTNGLDFYILDGEGKVIGFDKFSTAKSTNVTSAEAGSKTGSIKLSFGNTAQNVEIYYDGTDVYAVASKISTHSTQTAFPGDYNGWNNSSNQLSKTDTYAHTTTVKISAAPGHDSNRAKVVKSGTWDNQLGNEQIDALSSCYPKGNDWENYDNRILIKCATEMSVTPTVWNDGSKKWLTLIAIPTTKYNVTFSSDHGTAPATQQVSYDGVPTKPNDLSESGWEFKGWYTTDQYTTEYDFSVAIHAATTIYAKWEQKGCSSYSFHYGTKNQSDWTVECFDGSTYSIADFVIPNKPDYWVGWAGQWQGTSPYNYSQDATFANNLVLSQSLKTNESAGTKVGSAVGAKGTLKVDNSWGCCNKRINFDPAGYGLCYGTEGQAGWQAVALTQTSGVEYMSGDVTLTADMVNGTTSYYVGILAPGSDLGYVYMGHSETKKVNTMGTFYNGTWGSNLNTFAAGDKGKLRMWSDDFDNKNWKAHFVPYWTLKYDLNGESGTAPEGAEVFSEASQQERTVTITSTVPQATHKVFNGWYTEKTGGTKLDAGGEYILNAHATIYAHWTDAPQWTVSFDSDGGSAVASQTIWDGETATEPSPAPTKTDLSFKEWQLDGVKYDFSTPVTSNITLKAIWSDVCDMTDVKYAEPVVADMTKSNLFKESDNTEPAKLTKCQIKIGSQENHVAYYDANDANGYIKHGEGSSDAYYWYKIEAGDASYATDGKLYYLKNVANGKYLCISSVVIGTGNWGSNYTITADKTAGNATQCTWYFKQSNDKRLVNLSTKKNNTSNYEKGEMFLHRYQGVSSPAGTYTVTGSSDGNQGNWQLTTSFINSSTVDNPNYLKETVEQSGKTYYRFANNAVVSTTLPKALKAEDKITVYYYATAATAAELRINGTKVTDITITSAGVNTYVYTAQTADAGQTAVAVASNSTSFLMAQIEVARPTPTSPRGANLKWDEDLSAGVTRMVDDGEFTHVATAKGAGAITYSSSDEAVATVAANGTVTPVAAGTTVIKATLEQDGCYAGGEITYNVTLTDLSKPTITFTTLPEDAPQGSIQQVVVTTTGGDNFALAITGGTDATLNITENTGTQITATLSFGANATDIELTASTTRIEGVLAATNKISTATIAACYPTGTEIFAFTMQGSDAAANQPAAGIIGGTVDQTALGTKGTADNPATLDACYLKLNEGKYIYDNNGSVEVKEQKDDAGKWALIPTGVNYKPNWSNNTYKLYYIKNISTNKYMKRGAGQYGNNGQWLYYTTVTDATLGAGEEYQWFFSTDNDIVLVNKAGVRESLAASDHLHDCNQYNNVCDAYAAKPKVPCGITLDNMNAYTKIYDLASSTTTIPNPSFFKSVTYNEQTYYIISSEGKITINCNLLSGDTIMLDVYNRQTQTASVEKIAIASAAAKYDYTTTNEYLCLAGISVFRPKVGDFITPTLSFEAMTQPKIVEVNTSFTHTATSNVSTMAAITYASSNTDVATVDATTGEVTIAADAANLSSATITATMAALGCYEEAVASYDLLVKNAVPGALQAAIDATEAGETLTLAWDYTGDNGEISKAITLDAQGHEVGNLTVTTTGNLTLVSTLKTADLTLWAALGNQDNAAASAQVSGIEHITVQGDTWFYMDFDPSGAIQYGWYTMGVPFAVDATNGVYYLTADGAREKITRGVNYLFWAYDGAKRATGANGWGRFSGVLQPNTLYLITPDDELSTNTFCFLRHSGNIGGSASITLAENAATDPTNAGWNGVANSTLNYRNLSFSGDKVQLFNHDTEGFDVTSVADHTFVMGSAFFAQADGEETLLLTTTDQPGALRAPQRAAEATAEINIRLGANTSSYSDQLFVSTTQENKTTYQIGHDLVKMTYNAAKVPQLAVNAYNVSLCDAEMALDAQGQAFFPLTITSPSDENYMLYIHGEANQDVYVLENGNIIGHLNKGAVSLQIAKGTTTHYSLLILGTARGIVTDLSEPQESNQVEKILLNHTLYILRDGKLYDALGR